MQKGASCGRIAAGREQSFFVPGPPVQLGGEAPEGSQTAAGVENAVDPGLRSRQRSSRTREVGFAEQNVKGENGRGSGFFPAPGSGVHPVTGQGMVGGAAPFDSDGERGEGRRIS